MRLVLDCGILGKACHPDHPDNAPIARWLKRVLEDSARTFSVSIPEITDYELRRKLLHLARYKSAKQARISLATAVDRWSPPTASIFSASSLSSTWSSI